MAKAWHRGHEVSYDWDTRRWTYADGVPTIVERPCVRCGRMPTPDGHDACLGVIPGASSACCGHGVVEGFVMSGSNSAEECQPSKLDVAGSNPASRSRHNASATDSVGSPNLVPRSESTGGAIPPACSKTRTDGGTADAPVSKAGASGHEGSTPSRSTKTMADSSARSEHRAFNPGVVGSTPTRSTSITQPAALASQNGRGLPHISVRGSVGQPPAGKPRLTAGP